MIPRRGTWTISISTARRTSAWLATPLAARMPSTLMLAVLILAAPILAVLLANAPAACSAAAEKGPSAKIQTPKASPAKTAPTKDELSTAPAKVDVQPIAHDAQIRERLESVLSATGWFTDPEVRVEQGVVFLSGSTDSEELKKWAGDLARHTQDVVAVANQLDVTRPSAWDFSAGWSGLLDVWLDVVRAVPFVIFGMFILVLSALLGWLAAKGARRALFRIVRAKLLRTVLARAIGVFVFLAGAYIVLRVSGLTQLALTVVGGTGLIGLAVGIAFRDITENFLSSIFLSLQRPFETGDLIEVNNVTGYVQQLNIRTTVLMTLDGNLVQIPNATVYKSTLRNFTVNRNRRESFVVGIGYADPIDAAQEIARQVLSDHPAVLSDPEPWVLADSLGQSTVNLRIYFWLDGHQYSWLKVRSSVLRLVKRAFQEHGISMPDEAREVIFPRGVPVTLLGQNIAENHDSARLPAAAPPSTSAAEAQTAAPQPKRPQIGPAAAPTVPRAAVTANDGEKEVSNKAEGGLASEAGVLNEQARQAQPADAGENLLRGKK